MLATRIRWQNLARAAALAGAAIAAVAALPSLLSTDPPPTEPDVGLIAAEPEPLPPSVAAPPSLEVRAPGGSPAPERGGRKSSEKPKAAKAVTRDAAKRRESKAAKAARRRRARDRDADPAAGSEPPAAYVPPAPAYYPPAPAPAQDGFSFER